MNRIKFFCILCILFILSSCKKQDNEHANYLTVVTTEETIQPDAYLYSIGKNGKDGYAIVVSNEKHPQNPASVNNYKQAEMFIANHDISVVWNVAVTDSSWREALEYERKITENSYVLVSFKK